MHQPVEVNPEECDHDWEYQDDSFSHEFGTEFIFYWKCKHCDLTRDVNASDDFYEDDLND